MTSQTVRPIGRREGGDFFTPSPLGNDGGLILVFCLLFLRFRVGGSFRSGMQSPTGAGRSHDPLARGIPDIFIPRGCIRDGCLTSCARGMKIPE